MTLTMFHHWSSAAADIYNVQCFILTQGCTNALGCWGSQNLYSDDWYLWVLSMELASYPPSGT